MVLPLGDFKLDLTLGYDACKFQVTSSETLRLKQGVLVVFEIQEISDVQK